MHFLKMGNAVFSTQARHFLRLHATSLFVPERNRGAHHIRCTACNALHLPHNPHSNISDDLGDHAFVCRGGGAQQDAVGGWVSKRHFNVLSALFAAVKATKHRGNGAVVLSQEPHLLNADGVSPAAGVAGGNNDRADILVVDMDGKKTYLDLTISAPVTAGNIAGASIGTGYAADKAYQRKVADYSNRWVFDAGLGVSLRILAMETGGRMHPEFILWLKAYLKAHCADGSHSYYWAYKNSVQRISIALRASLALSFLSLGEKAKLYPSVLAVA